MVFRGPAECQIIQPSLFMVKFARFFYHSSSLLSSIIFTLTLLSTTFFIIVIFSSAAMTQHHSAILFCLFVHLVYNSGHCVHNVLSQTTNRKCPYFTQLTFRPPLQWPSSSIKPVSHKPATLP